MQNTEQIIIEKVKGAYEAGKKGAAAGTVASYIPELAKSDGSDFGICVMQRSGSIIGFGDTDRYLSPSGKQRKGFPFRASARS